MAFFDKKADECTTDFDRWCYMFKHLGELTDAPEGFRDKVMCRLMSAARIANFNRKQKKLYINVAMDKEYNKELIYETWVGGEKKEYGTRQSGRWTMAYLRNLLQKLPDWTWIAFWHLGNDKILRSAPALRGIYTYSANGTLTTIFLTRVRRPSGEMQGRWASPGKRMRKLSLSALTLRGWAASAKNSVSAAPS